MYLSPTVYDRCHIGSRVARRASLALQQLVVVVFVLQQLECLVGLLVALQRVLDGTTLIVVCGDNVVVSRALMLSLLWSSSLATLCFQFALQGLKLGLGIIEVALKLGHFLEVLQALLTQGIVLEVALEHHLF
jgi:hypothetical protein